MLSRTALSSLKNGSKMDSCIYKNVTKFALVGKPRTNA